MMCVCKLALNLPIVFLRESSIILKQITAIGLLGLLLFNMLGHYPVYMGMQWQARQDMEHRLDTEDIYGHELFQVKIPINLPYWQNMQDYERVTGRFEHHGEFYTLFKQKVQDDTLFLVCVKDRQQKQLLQKLTEAVQLTFSDAPGTHQKAAKFLENLTKDYLSHQCPTTLLLSKQGNLLQWLPTYSISFYDTNLTSFSPPPERFCFDHS